jgi:sucrose-6-phosphate hydrolase SacC (GH32 family)
MFNAWRDPFVVRDESGEYHAYLCARSGPWTPDRTGACVAHATSRDLVTWTHRQPIFETDRVKYLEVPGLIELDGRHYLYFLDHGWGGLRIHTPSREDTAGTYYVVGDSAEGPFHWPDDPLLVGGGQDRQGAWAARTLAHNGGHMLFHHITARRSSLAIPKQVRARDDGSLYLEYLPVIDHLEKDPKLTHDDLARRGALTPRAEDSGRWHTTAGGILGECGIAGASLMVSADQQDTHAQVTVRAMSAARASIVLRSDEGSQTGVVVTLDFERQHVELELLHLLPWEGWGHPAADIVFGGNHRDGDKVRRALRLETDYRLRCIVRAEFIEVYLDDESLFSRAIASAARSGAIELAVERGAARFSELRVAPLAPLDEQA